MEYKIICLIGPSGAGKTTIAEGMASTRLMSHIASYTTRPMRNGEENGREHRFVADYEANKHIVVKNHIAAFAKIGGYRYFTTWQQLTERKYMIYVIDENGYRMLKQNIAQKKYLNELDNLDTFRLIPVQLKRSHMDIAKSVEVTTERMMRDKDRAALAPGEYAIIIINDAATAEQTHLWSVAFAETLVRVFAEGKDFSKQLFLHTSELCCYEDIESRLKKINNTKNYK